MEDESLKLIRNVLPKEWVIRDYKPDYGIDISIELFEPVENTTSFDTLGEWFFAQVKSVQKTNIKTIKVYSRGNVEKSELKTDKKDFLTIDVIPFQIDTDELLTIQAMGAGVPVLLILATLDTNKLYFVCLNDLLDKCIIPEDRNFDAKKTKTIHIPVKNEITKDGILLGSIKFLAKRPKLYAAFSKFTYQKGEIESVISSFSLLSVSNIVQSSDLDMLIHFINIIKRYDFWKTTNMWTVIRDCYNKILKIEQVLKCIKNDGALPKELILHGHKWVTENELSEFGQDELLLFMFISEIQILWSNLTNLNDMYEEICREWFLPTYLAQLMSYPD